jgi:hypothetical protein
MSSTLTKKVRYVKDRCINAYWMLRTGKFKLIFKSIYIELHHRIEDIRAWLYKGKELDDSQVPGSRFVNKCKIVPPSHRPTTSQASALPPLRVDSMIVAKELQNILDNFLIQDHSNS